MSSSRDGGDGPTKDPKWEKSVSEWRDRLSTEFDRGDFYTFVKNNQAGVEPLLEYLQKTNGVMVDDNKVFYEAAKSLELDSPKAQEYGQQYDRTKAAKQGVGEFIQPGGSGPVTRQKIDKAMGRGSGGDISKL